MAKQRKTSVSSSLFSGVAASVPKLDTSPPATGTAGSAMQGGFLSGIGDALGRGLQQSAQVIGQSLPVFTGSLIESQTGDQSRDPTFDQRFSGQPISGADRGVTQDTQQTVAQTRGIVPGVPNNALLFGVVALAATFVLARSL